MRPHLASLVEEFRKHSSETAVVAHRGNRRYPATYGQLASLAGRFSAELARRGIAPGDRVVIWGENSAEWIGVFFGCLLRGVIAVPLDAAGAPGFAARVIRDVAPKLIVGDLRLLNALEETAEVHLRSEGREEHVPGAKAHVDAEGMPGLKSRPITETTATSNRQPATSNQQPTTDNPQPTAGNQQPATGKVPQLSLAAIADHLPAEPLFTVSDAIQPHTPFQIVFTSGTTSEPRGIVHTHRNVLVTLQPIENEMAKYRRYERIFHPLRFLHSLPLSHVFGQFMGLWIPALLAAEVHFAEQLEPSRVTDLIRRERISVLIAVPRILHLLRAHLLARFPQLAAELEASAGINIQKRWWKFRRVHGALGWKFWAVISGGATLPADLEAFWNRLGFALIQGYGMTETAALVTLNHPFHIAPGTIGKPLPGREVKITGEGEILVRGDMLASATWQGGSMHQRQGEWLATGDLAEKDASGDLRFLGRKGDVIVTAAGMNIHPGDLESALEAALGDQPGFRACAVVPCELPTGTEPVAVVLSSAAGGEFGAGLNAAVAAANRTLADYQQIRRILRWPEIQFPYTSTGKLIRRQIAQWACDTLNGRRESAAGAATPGDDALLSLIAELTGEPIAGNLAAAAPRSLRLSEDLHLDSLGRVQLQSAIEQTFGLEFADDDLATIETLHDLRALIESRLNPAAAAPTPTSNPPQPQPTAESQQLTAAAPQRKSDNRDPTAHSYPEWPWTWPILVLRIAFLELILRPLVWLLAAPRVIRAQADLPDAPLLIIANHVTAYDGAFVLYALPFRLRLRVAAAMSGEMLLDFRHARNQPNALANFLAPMAYWLITALFNVFPLPRARGFRRSFAHAGKAMDRGYSVLIFPEGTRSGDGKLHDFRPGIGLLAQESRVPIVPIALVGLYEMRAERAHNRPARWFRSGKLEIRIGAAIPVEDNADPAHLTRALEQAVRALQFPSPPSNPPGPSF